MKYLVKRPNGDTMTVTLENLAARVDNGAVHADWPAKPEEGTEWSTVGAVLATHSPAPAPTPPTGVTQAASSSSDSFTWSACGRYQDAYLVARATTGIGAVVKFVGIGLGVLVWLVMVILGSQANRTGEAFLGGLVFGAVVAIPLYVLGVLVSALGEVLKATLDTAMHGSPFVKKEDMARVMSL